MQFYMIYVSFILVFIVNNRGKCPGVGFELVFIGPRGGGFELFFARGVGNSPIKKIARGFCPRGMVRLGID